MNKLPSVVITLLLCFGLCSCTLGVPETTRQTVLPTSTNTVCVETDLNNLPIQSALDAYIRYMECQKTDSQKSFVEYCYFPSQESLDLALSTPYLLYEYEVLHIKQLTKQLWEIEFFAKSSIIEGGLYAANYVGLINGEYRVMTSISNIPQSLKENVEIEPYEPHGPGIVNPDDVIGAG